MINSTYNQVNPNLQILETEEIIKITNYGRLKMVELEIANPKTQALLKALHILNSPTQGLQSSNQERKVYTNIPNNSECSEVCDHKTA